LSAPFKQLAKKRFSQLSADLDKLDLAGVRSLFQKYVKALFYQDSAASIHSYFFFALCLTQLYKPVALSQQYPDQQFVLAN
jgi:hypothetical protein